ncbi:MAG: hypothetical protein FWF40_01550, partial [Methanomassiliicoccaceae archaeon]|nr:hypothetical protein [Methanomassiliicoccaceae archaeon]
MLEVLARSQRGRICEFRCDDIVIRTPAVLRSVPNGGIHISVSGTKRELVIGSKRIIMDRGL